MKYKCVHCDKELQLGKDSMAYVNPRLDTWRCHPRCNATHKPQVKQKGSK